MFVSSICTHTHRELKVTFNKKAEIHYIYFETGERSGLGLYPLCVFVCVRERVIKRGRFFLIFKIFIISCLTPARTTYETKIQRCLYLFMLMVISAATRYRPRDSTDIVHYVSGVLLRERTQGVKVVSDVVPNWIGEQLRTRTPVSHCNSAFVLQSWAPALTIS